MGEHTGIQWTNATFNPWWGCVKISPGCDNCYAEGVARRFHAGIWGPNSARRVFEDRKHWNAPLGWNRKAQEAGKVMRVFCGSMCDVFENHSVAAEYRPELFSLIMRTPWLHWQLLTKRIGNVHKMVPESWLTRSWPRNAWIGATVVNQEEADRDIPKLLQLPFNYNGITGSRSPVRFLSCEPLLGRIDISRYLGACNCNVEALEGAGMHSATCPATSPRVDWVICGGESGNQARPMRATWAQSLRDQCAAAGVPFFFKQWGEWLPCGQAMAIAQVVQNISIQCFSDVRDEIFTAVRLGKKVSGRLLDGVEHNAFPVT